MAKVFPLFVQKRDFLNDPFETAQFDNWVSSTCCGEASTEEK